MSERRTAGITTFRIEHRQHLTRFDLKHSVEVLSSSSKRRRNEEKISYSRPQWRSWRCSKNLANDRLALFDRDKTIMIMFYLCTRYDRFCLFLLVLRTRTFRTAITRTQLTPI